MRALIPFFLCSLPLAASEWTAPEQFSSGKQSIVGITLAVGNSNQPVILWSEYELSLSVNRLYSRSYANGQWFASQKIGNADAQHYEVYPSIACGTNMAMAIWKTYVDAPYVIDYLNEGDFLSRRLDLSTGTWRDVVPMDTTEITPGVTGLEQGLDQLRILPGEQVAAGWHLLSGGDYIHKAGHHLLKTASCSLDTGIWGQSQIMGHPYDPNVSLNDSLEGQVGMDLGVQTNGRLLCSYAIERFDHSSGLDVGYTVDAQLQAADGSWPSPTEVYGLGQPPGGIYNKSVIIGGKPAVLWMHQTNSPAPRYNLSIDGSIFDGNKWSPGTTVWKTTDPNLGLSSKYAVVALGSDALLWFVDNDTLYAAEVHPDLSISPAVQLATGVGQDLSKGKFAAQVTAAGGTAGAVITWVKNGSDGYVYAVLVTPGPAFSPVQKVSADIADRSTLAAAINDRGQGVVAWEELNHSANGWVSRFVIDPANVSPVTNNTGNTGGNGNNTTTNGGGNTSGGGSNASSSSSHKKCGFFGSLAGSLMGLLLVATRLRRRE